MHQSNEAVVLDTTNQVPQSQGVWAILKEAVLGSRRDFTQGSIGLAIFLLAVPMVLEVMMEGVFALVDIYFVGRLGADATAAVGFTESMMAIVYTLAMGLSIGVTATVARRIGEKKPEEAAKVAVQGLIIGAVLSVLISIIGIVFAPNLLSLMGAHESVIATGSNFTRIMIGGNAVVLFLFLINGIFRGAGDAAIAMRVLWLANAINIVLGPCLIFGLGPFPELGVTGAAIATTIGRGTGALFAFSRLIGKNSRVPVRLNHFKVVPDVIKSLIRFSSSTTFQILIHTASWVFVVRIISTFGEKVVAGHTIGMRIIMFALLPSWGMSNAAATLVGQSLGAKKSDRAEKAVWIAGFYNMCFLGLIGFFFVVFPERIVSLGFTNDPEVFKYAVMCLRTVACGFLFYAFGMVLTQSFNGAGDTRTPTVINLFVFWLWELPFAYILAVTLGFGPQGVFFAITVAFSTLAVVSAIIFRQGKWKKGVV